MSDTQKAQSTVRALIERLGRENVIEHCGITSAAVSIWITQDWIPDARYLQLAELGRKRRVRIPSELFSSARTSAA